MEMQSLLLEHPRACFICLEDDDELVSCCTRCYGVAHARCWREWRANQRTSALRTRQSGNGRVRDPFLCSICKTGRARLEGESLHREWMETVLSAMMQRTERGGGSETDMFEDLDEDAAFSCCTRRVILTNILVVFGLSFAAILIDQFELLSTSAVVMAVFLLLTQWIIFMAAWGLAERRRIWRERHRPISALITEEMSVRSGRLFPTDVIIRPD
jgi:hypothetical protein